MKTLSVVTEAEREIFKRFQKPQYKYETFEVHQNLMDGGTINDTPEGAYILAKQICEDCLPDVLTRCKYGLIVKRPDNKFLHCDLHILEGGEYGCSFRTKKGSAEIFPFEEKPEVIYEVMKRHF